MTKEEERQLIDFAEKWQPDGSDEELMEFFVELLDLLQTIAGRPIH